LKRLLREECTTDSSRLLEMKTANLPKMQVVSYWFLPFNLDWQPVPQQLNYWFS